MTTETTLTDIVLESWTPIDVGVELEIGSVEVYPGGQSAPYIDDYKITEVLAGSRVIPIEKLGIRNRQRIEESVETYVDDHEVEILDEVNCD